MARYHINYKGNPGICHAKNKCPFGDIKTEHYSSKDEAQEAFEKSQSVGTLPNPKVVKAENNYNKSIARRDNDMNGIIEQASMNKPQINNQKMKKFAVHIDKPSFRGSKTSKIMEAASPAEAKRIAEETYGTGSVMRVLTLPTKSD
jgi:hypothetical protein